MSNEGLTHTAIQSALEAIEAGHPHGWDDLVRASQQRLLRITRSALVRYQRLRRWEESSDVLQTAQMKLHEYYTDKTPASPRDFLNLAARIIENVLVDLTRHHFGALGRGNHHSTPDPGAGASGSGVE